MPPEHPGSRPHDERIWRLWQIETSFACNLSCVMCPWRALGRDSLPTDDGLMKETVFNALRPHLAEVIEVDFSGGGEPLLHPTLAEWIEEAGRAGCRTGFLTNGTLLGEEATRNVLAAGVDWIGFSADGAVAESFEKIRQGASFDEFCANVGRLTSLRTGKVPRVLFNFVMMKENVSEMEGIVRLAAALDVDQVIFKHCDVVRGEEGRRFGLFGPQADREIRRHEKALGRARKIAKKLGVETAAFSFVPDELPVCGQDPRRSLFVAHDGRVAPCINLAIGGSTWFLGEEVEMPTVTYGRLPEQRLLDLWESEICRLYRDRFEARVGIYNARLSEVSFARSLTGLEEALEAARKAMPPAPGGCRICHYLHDI
jgi:MoaA/NifB/PqqE/SkfB family radical SAM enzyme